MSEFISIEKTDERRNGYVIYKCICSCGNIVFRRSSELKKCLPMCPNCARKVQGEKVSNHGMTSKNARLHRICYKAKKRCEDVTDKAYKYYGGRGIEFKFNSIKHMFDWSLENGYSDNLTIDRIDVNGHYEPSNCRWVTMEDQANNKTNNVSYNGIVGISNIAKDLGITEKRLGMYLYKKHLTLEEIYKLSKTDPLFNSSNSERRSIMQRKQSCHWSINKEQAIEICKNIDNGSNISKEAKRLSVDYITVKRAIARLKDGIYDL